MNVSRLLTLLPESKWQVELIEEEQDTKDIIDEVLESHEINKAEYDLICNEAIGRNTKETCRNIFDFITSALPYNAESVKQQTALSPSTMLEMAKAGHTFDCKHYSGFTAGILDALNRQGYEIDWCYRFGYYPSGDPYESKDYGHVFVVVNDDEEIWIDAAPYGKEKGTSMTG